MRMVYHLICQSAVSNTGACSTTSWIPCVKYNMNTLRGLFSLFSKGPSFFSQPESSSKWVGSPIVNLHQHWSQVVIFFIFLRYPQFHGPQPHAVSVRMTNFTMILTLPFGAMSALTLLLCSA